MAVIPVQTHAQSTTAAPIRVLRRARLVSLARKAVARVSAAATTARVRLDQHDVSAQSVAEQVTNVWWTGVDWTMRQPFQWAVTRARLDLLAYRWDLDGRADRLQAWACALDALANARRALRDHPDIAEEGGVVEQLMNQSALLRAIATADRARFLRAQEDSTFGAYPTRCPATPDIEALVGTHLDQLSRVSTPQGERIVLLAQMKVLLEPTLGAAAVHVLHDIY